MEHPFGHNHHHHHHRRNDEEEEEQRPPHFPPPPPPFAQPPSYYNPNEFSAPRPPPPSDFYQETEYAPPPPPPQVTHLHHSGDQPEFNYQQPPPPQVTHLHHSGDQPEFNYQQPPPRVSDQEEPHHSSFKPHLPSFMHHHHSSSASHLSNKPTVKVCCKAQPDFSLTIRDNKVLLAPADPSDDFQHWYKDEKYSTRVKDEEGFPCFALVNKAAGLAMKHSVGDTHPVQLVPYNPDVLDESVLWTLSRDTGEGYRTIRMVNNIRLNVDAFNGDKKHGGVHDGTTIVLWQWKKGDNQRWKIIPYSIDTTNTLIWKSQSKKFKTHLV